MGIRSGIKKLMLMPRLLSELRQMQIHDRLDHVRAARLAEDPKHLLPYGGKVYSQVDEDGILQEIFRRIGTTNKRFVEFGVGNGVENNTVALLLQGWSGLWIEGSAECVRQIHAGLPKMVAAGRLKCVNAFIYTDNIDALIGDNSPRGEIDLLSVDIDGNDYHVWEAIRCIDPRVVVFEYNAKFRPPIAYCMPYAPQHRWAADDRFGVSLTYLEQGLHKRGYALVGCNASGANAFFVRQDLVGDHFSAPYTAEHHFEPARYYLANNTSGHPPCLTTVDEALTD